MPRKNQSPPKAKTFKECFSLTCCWGPRKESFEECAERTIAFIEGLSKIDPIFRHWQTSLEADPIEMSCAGLTRIFAKGIIREEIYPYKRIEDLGCSATLFTRGNWTLPLRIHAGCYGCVDNILTLDLPAGDDEWERIGNTANLCELWGVVVRCWEPNNGYIDSFALWDALGKPKSKNRVGWLTYVANPPRPNLTLPVPIQMKPLGKDGVVIVATEERFSSENRAHLKAIQVISNSLNDGS